MTYWVGLMLFAGGVGLILWGVIDRRRRVALMAEIGESSPTSLAVMGEIVRPLVVLALVYTGVKASLAYAAFGGGRVFSVFDLGGFLFLLASYGAWLYLRTKPIKAVRPAGATAHESVPRDEDEKPALPSLDLPIPHRMSA